MANSEFGIAAVFQTSNVFSATTNLEKKPLEAYRLVSNNEDIKARVQTLLDELCSSESDNLFKFDPDDDKPFLATATPMSLSVLRCGPGALYLKERGPRPSDRS